MKEGQGKDSEQMFNYEDIVKKLQVLLNDLSLSDIIHGPDTLLHSIELLSQINIPPWFKLTKELSIILEFFGLLGHIKEGKYSKFPKGYISQKRNEFANKFLYTFSKKLNRFLIYLRRIYKNNFYLYLKCINILFRILKKTTCLYLHNTEDDDYENNETLWLYSRIEPQFKDNYIVVNYSVLKLDWKLNWIEDKIYPIIEKSTKDEEPLLSELKIIRFAGDGINVEISNSSAFQAILETLNNLKERVQIIIIPDKFVITVNDSAKYYTINIVLKVENFQIFKCQKQVKFNLDWNNLISILQPIKNISEIEFLIEENDLQNKFMNLRLRGKDLDPEEIYNVKLEEFEEHVLQALLNIKYTTEFQIEPTELLPIFNYNTLKLIEFNVYEDLTGNAKCSINASDPEYYKDITVVNPKIKLLKFKDMTRGSFRRDSSYRVKDFKLIRNIMSIIRQLKFFSAFSRPLKLEMEIEGGIRIIYFIAMINKKVEDYIELKDLVERQYKC